MTDTATGYYLVVALPKEPGIIHVRFEKHLIAMQSLWHDTFIEHGVHGKVVGNNRQVMYPGATNEESTATP